MINFIKGSIALCRLDKPIGIYLIFWPALAAAVISTDVISNLDVLAIILIGSILVRSIGCVINDIFDKDIDNKVERTKSRPLASGQLTTLEGWIIFSILAICILALLIQTNLQTRYCQFHFWMHDYSISLNEAFFSRSSIILRDYL